MTQPQRIIIRPGYGSQLLLVEFCGDHRDDGFPDVCNILRLALQSEHVSSDAREVERALATDCYSSSWRYSGGSYLIDDDTWGLWIHCEENNQQVVGHIEQALLDSGLFVKEEVDFSDYA